MEKQPLMRLARVQEDLRHAEDQGYFGPSSAIWRIHREAVLGLGLFRALLMELAHPWVAQAVADHSDFQENPGDRLLAITEAALLIVFGSRAQADQAASRIRGVHARIRGLLSEDVGRWRRGTPYRADDPEALLWVWITLVDTTLRMYDYCLGALGEADQHAYLRDAGRLGEMLGIPRRLLPADRAGLDAYTTRWLNDGTLAVGSHALHLATELQEVPLLGLPQPVLHLYRSLELSAALRFLPAQLRVAFAPALRRRGLLARALFDTVPRVLPRVPGRLRTDPIARVAVYRWRPATV